jgi:hypothetical protein
MCQFDETTQVLHKNAAELFCHWANFLVNMFRPRWFLCLSFYGTDLNILLRSSSLPCDVIDHIVDVTIVVQIIQKIRSSSFRDGATTTMVVYQPNAPPRPAEDAYATAAAPAIERPTVADIPVTNATAV